MELIDFNEKRKHKKEMLDIFDELLSVVSKNISPSPRMIRFYNFMGRFPRVIGIPLLLLTSVDAWKVIILAGLFQRTDAALQIIYSYKFRPWRLIWGIGDALWQGAYNCRSVRKRGLFVKELIPILLAERQRLIGYSSKPKLVSIGSGSALQLFQSINENQLNSSVHVVLVDRDAKALKRGRKNAYKLNVESTEFQKTTVGYFLKNTEKRTVDVVEMVGLTDYFPEKHLKRYFQQIKNVLSDEGFFIGANISSTEEYSYAHGIVCWPEMYYREKEEIVILLEEAGFQEIWAEYCGLYTIWIAKR